MTAQQKPETAEPDAPVDENQIIAERRAKLARLRAGGIAFPNDFQPADRAAGLVAGHEAKSREELQQEALAVSVAGRMILKRVQGKASFATVQDSTGKIQLWLNDEGVGAEAHEAFKHWDLGDIVDAAQHCNLLLTPHQTVAEEDLKAIADNEITSLKHGV